MYDQVEAELKKFLMEDIQPLYRQEQTMLEEKTHTILYYRKQ